MPPALATHLPEGQTRDSGLRPPLGARCRAGALGGVGGAERDWSGGGAALKGSAPSLGGGAEGLNSDLDLLDTASSDGGTLDSESLGQAWTPQRPVWSGDEHPGLIT